MAGRPAPREVRRYRQQAPRSLCRRAAAVHHHRGQPGAVPRQAFRRPGGAAQALPGDLSHTRLPKSPRLPLLARGGGQHQAERPRRRAGARRLRGGQRLRRLALPHPEERLRADVEPEPAGPRLEGRGHLQDDPGAGQQQSGGREGRLPDPVAMGRSQGLGRDLRRHPGLRHDQHPGTGPQEGRDHPQLRLQRPGGQAAPGLAIPARQPPCAPCPDHRLRHPLRRRRLPRDGRRPPVQRRP
ncbi:hypothetical protein D9M69_416390 [compost metagenome]